MCGAATFAAQALPDGPGAAVVQARCTSCHETDLIASQRLSVAGWTREVDKMIRWGARATDADRAVLLSYLAERFGDNAAASEPATDAGMGVLERACLTCHQRDVIEMQRLTRDGWTREVEKMIRWGAVVRDADKEPLIAALASRYPPR